MLIRTFLLRRTKDERDHSQSNYSKDFADLASLLLGLLIIILLFFFFTIFICLFFRFFLCFDPIRPKLSVQNFSLIDLNNPLMELISGLTIDSFMRKLMIILQINGQKLNLLFFHDELMEIVDSFDLNWGLYIGIFNLFMIFVQKTEVVAKTSWFYWGQFWYYLHLFYIFLTQLIISFLVWTLTFLSFFWWIYGDKKWVWPILIGIIFNIEITKCW